MAMSREPTRDKLMAAGTKLLSANGYEKTTIGDIERAAGLTPRAGGFYRHFKSKEALLLAIAADRFETPEKIGLFTAFPLGDTRAELIFIARAYERLNQDGHGISHVIRVEAARIPELQRKLADANAAVGDAFTDWIAEKPALKNKSRKDATEVMLIIFGGWLFYLSRREELPSKPAISSQSILTRWADHWASALDGKKIGL